MRILLVGQFETQAIERSYATALANLGASVEPFDWPGAGAPRARRELVKRPILAGLWPRIARRANRELVAVADAGYDVIFVVKGLFVDRSTVDALRRPGRAVVCFNPDNPWNRSPASYSYAGHEAMPAWDAYLIWSSFLVSRLYCAGCRRVEVLPFGWDPDANPYQATEPGAETREIVFAGGWSLHREQWIRQISDLPVTLYGSRWAEVVEPLGDTALRVEATVPYRQEYAKETAGAKIALNILDPHNCPGTNMRSFEIPGVGGVACSTWTEDVEGFFPEGAVRTFRTEEQLREQVADLRGNADARAEIRRRSHAIAERHTYRTRAEWLLSFFDDLLQRSSR